MAENVFAITEWLGQYSGVPSTAVPPGGLTAMLNFDFIGPNRLKTRGGLSVYINLADTSKHIIAALEVKKSTESIGRLVFATSDGVIYTMPTDGSTSTPTNIGSISGSPTRVRFAFMKDTVYIADYGNGAYKTDLSTVTAIVAGLPAGAVYTVTDVLMYEKRLWWLDTNNFLIGSEVNDSDTWSGGTSFNVRIGRGDGMTADNMVSWFGNLYITKFDSATYRTSLHKLTGDSSSNFAVEQVTLGPKSNFGFISQSAAQVGNEVFALTFDGFVGLSSVNADTGAEFSFISQPIEDVIKRINWSYAYKISSCHDPYLKQYMCAVPLDGASFCNYVIIYDYVNGRWGLYSNWTVRSMFLIKDYVYIGGQNGKIYKTRQSGNDDGVAYPKRLETGDINLGFGVDAVQLFQDVMIEILQDGEYTVTVTPVIDGQEMADYGVDLSLGEGALPWDTFVWDTDTWDTNGYSSKHIWWQLRGKYARLRITNSELNETFEIRSASIRGKQTDLGQALY